ncbi:MAG: hypothetical protein HY903_01450 [Deltaproteobacteria bacterium]|nr:hypothetical protein [Deltaproteobacteria bacterium]
MSDNDDFDAFDRLAGQPSEPTADTGVLLSSAEGGDRSGGFDVGSVKLTGSHPSLRMIAADPLPWAVGGVLGVLLLVVLFAWTLPMRGDLHKAQADLDEITKTLDDKNREIARLEAERAELERARTSLAAENEQRANAGDQAARDSESQDAASKKAQVAAKKPKKVKKPKRR